jgi:hypothetical protein
MAREVYCLVSFWLSRGMIAFSYNDKSADNFFGRIMVLHDHPIDKIGCQTNQDDKECELKSTSTEEGGADGSGSVAWNLHDDGLEGS